MGNLYSQPEPPKHPVDSMNEKRRDAVDKRLDKEVRKHAEHSDVPAPIMQAEVIDDLAGIDPFLYKYPFENLAFEGGGNKGFSYVGAIQVLEKTGIRPQIRRISGTSIGAITAAFMAVGFTSDEIEEFLKEDLEALALDAWKISWPYNLMNGYGLNPAKKLDEWIADVIGQKTGNPDITFFDVFRKYDMELCVVVTNVNKKTEYFAHVKTTPHMPIRKAVRASMSFPFLFQPVTNMERGKKQVYVDGGLLCNYPICAWDGWWLSLDPKDSFLQRLQPLAEIPKLMMNTNRFGKRNENTIGFVLYSEDEHGALRLQLENRDGINKPEIPDTTLGRKYKKNHEIQEVASEEYIKTTEAVECYLNALRKHTVGSVEVEITKEQLEAAFNDPDFADCHKDVLFENTDLTHGELFESLDDNKDGKIKYQALIYALGDTGAHIMDRFHGYGETDIDGLKDFTFTLAGTIINNVERIYTTEEDANRSVGINTGHVGTQDFDLEQADRDCIIKQGYDSTITFLKHYVKHKNPPKRDVPNVIIADSTTKRARDDDTSDTTRLLSRKKSS